MLETQTTTPQEKESLQPKLAAAIDRMLTLRWPDYADPDHRLNYAADSYAQVNDTTYGDNGDTHEPLSVINGFYLDTADPAIWDSMSPAEIREVDTENDAIACRQLARLIASGPFAACNPRVAEAFAQNIIDATHVLARAMSEQDDGASKYDHATYSYDSGVTLQAMLHTLAGVAVQLGAIDREEAYVNFSTQSFPGMESTAKTMRKGRLNSYRIRYLGEMEYHESDWGETPTFLDISAIPGSRAAFELRFISDTLTDRFTSHMQLSGKELVMQGFSIRIDYDEKSPYGFSVDIGRDERDTATLVRNADPAGKSLQAIRPNEGSHFGEHFKDVTRHDMEEFIRNLALMLEADAHMDKYVKHLNNRTLSDVT